MLDFFHFVGLLHIIFYSCAGLLWVGKHVIRSLRIEDSDTVKFFKKVL